MKPRTGTRSKKKCDGNWADRSEGGKPLGRKQGRREGEVTTTTHEVKKREDFIRRT